MTENFYLNQEHIEQLVLVLENSLLNIQYLIGQHHKSFIDRHSLLALSSDIEFQITYLKNHINQMLNNT
jgi:hypothetical protein